MHVNRHLSTILNSEYHHLPFMSILGLHAREMATMLVVNTILCFHIDHNTPRLPPKILHNHCSQFLLGITVVPREIEDDGYVKSLGAHKVLYGANGE